MKEFFAKVGVAAAALAAIVGAMLMSEVGRAQTVTPLPAYVNPGTVTDLGNGPVELKIIQGNALLATSSGAGIGSTSGSSTALTLTTTPATPPCVGCVITGVINANGSNPVATGTTVINYNGTTTVGLSSAQTIAAGTSLVWGAACPTTPGVVLPVQGGVGGDFPFYTLARICAYSPNGPGAAVLPFAIGAH